MNSNTQDSGDRQEAAKILVEFVAKFSGLLEDLLESVRSDMAETVDQVMVQLGKVNQTSALQKSKAHQVIKGEETAQIEGEAKKANESNAEGILAKPSVAAKAEFVNKMQSLEHLDARIQKLMMTMMGALSADDVVGHRIKHTQIAIALLSQGLGQIVDQIDTKLTREKVADLNQEIRKKVYATYSMEEERAYFHKIFGKDTD